MKNIIYLKNTFAFWEIKYTILSFSYYLKSPSDKFSSYHLSRKFLFANDRDHYRKGQTIKMQSRGTQSQLLHLLHKSCTCLLLKS